MGSGDLRRGSRRLPLLSLATLVVTMSTLVTGFFIAPALVQSGAKGIPHSIIRPRMVQSPALELVDDSAKLRGLAKTVFEKDSRPVLLYDGVCNMCNGFVNLFLDIDTEKKFRFSALQSQTGRALLSMSGRSPDDISSIVLVEENGAAHIQSDALLRMGRLLGGPVGLVLFPGVLVPKFVRNKMYDIVADNRYRVMGKREDCRCSDERYADRFV